MKNIDRTEFQLIMQLQEAGDNGKLDEQNNSLCDIQFRQVM